MSQNLFAELDITLSDDVMSKLNELATTLPYNERSVLNQYTDDFTMSLSSDLDAFIKEFNCDMAITRIEPNSHLIWHKDISPMRTCVINVPLKEFTNQATYITEQNIEKAFESRNGSRDETGTIKIHTPYQIPYNYKKPYLINVSEKYHCVFNCSNEYRYLLGIQTGKINHQQALDYFINLGLVHQ